MTEAKKRALKEWFVHQAEMDGHLEMKLHWESDWIDFEDDSLFEYGEEKLESIEAEIPEYKLYLDDLWYRCNIETTCTFREEEE